MTRQGYNFLFLIGASGSGTTMLTRILTAAQGSVGLGGNHISIPKSDRQAYDIARRFKRANDRLWDRKASAAESSAGGDEMLSLVGKLRTLPGYQETERVVFKRSAPFHRGDRYRPDLADLGRLFSEPRVVVLYRDPRASTASSHRRRFAANLRACAVITDEQLTYLSAQLATLDRDRWLLVPYEGFCAAPGDWSEPLADFCGLPPAVVAEAITAERVDSAKSGAWRRRLSSEELAFLDAYFDHRRLAQWPLLSGMEAMQP